MNFNDKLRVDPLRSILRSTRSYLEGLLPARPVNSTPLPAPGLYHYRLGSGEEQSRVHLRLDPSSREGSLTGLLLVNASRTLHLNPTAALMAYLVLEQVPEADAAAALTRRYRIRPAQALVDFQIFQQQLNELLRPDGACPVCDFDLEMAAPFSIVPAAPYRMDLALTYRCNNDCAHCYNARPRSHPEIDTATWKLLLDRIWEAGIPHVVFTGGEPTLRDDLPELVAHAEQNGQITGLNTNGRRLKDLRFLEQLVEAGLDHVQITLESHDPAVHDRMVGRSGAWKQTVDGLRNALGTRLFVMTNTTLLVENSPGLDETLNFLAETGVPTLGLNALIYAGRGETAGTGLPESALPPLLELARSATERRGQRLIWYTPTQYCNFDPVQMDLGVKGCTAARYNMCIEPDGSVLPCQSYYQPLGSLLSDSWESIWNHELAVRLRERQGLPEKCHGCLLLSECGGGCPLYMTRS